MKRAPRFPSTVALKHMLSSLDRAMTLQMATANSLAPQGKNAPRRSTALPRFVGSGKCIPIYWTSNKMQNDNTDHQFIDPCDVYGPDDLKLCKIRSEKRNKCRWDYDLNAQLLPRFQSSPS